MITRLLIVAAALGCAVSLLSLGGCTTTQERSASLARNAADAAEAKKFKVGKTNDDVEVAKVTWLEGEGAAAVVVRVESDAKATQVAVPIGLDLYDEAKASLYTNRVDGLEPALNTLAVVPPGESWWVNNQVPVDEPARTRVRIGTSKVAEAPAQLPEIDVSGDLRIGEDVGVITGSGTVANRSTVDQVRLTIYAVAFKGDKVVAAGRAVIDRLPAKTKKPAKFNVYFTGDPRGAELRVFAPPSTLGGA